MKLATRSRTALIASSALALVACAGQQPPSGELPPGLPGAVLQGTYTGTAAIRGELAGMTVYGPVDAELRVDVATGPAGQVTGIAQAGLAGEPLPPVLRDVSGVNDAGNVTVDLNVRLCGQKVNLTLTGTVNPFDTMNFAGLERDSVCGGGLGTLSVDPFKLKAVPQ